LSSQVGFTTPKQPKERPGPYLRKPCVFAFVKEPKAACQTQVKRKAMGECQAY